MSEARTKVLKICNDAKKANLELANLKNSTKDQVLLEVVKLLKKNTPKILKANNKDVKLARERHLDPAKVDRLILDEKRIIGISNAIKDIVKSPDPIGRVLFETKREENGLHIKRVSTPIGVLLAIYESRPNVTSDIASLAIKSGNAVILRCGSDSINTSKVLAEIYREALSKLNLDKNSVTLITSTDREYVVELLKMNEYIDVVIPRGGKSLIKAVSENTKIPLFHHLEGNCHIYIHEKADLDKACKIILNAKMRRVGICGAAESLLVDKKIAKKAIPLIINVLDEAGCEVRGDEESQSLDKRIKAANEEDFSTEYLDKIISLKVVKDIDDAIKKIALYSSSHTESIVTEEKAAAEKFLKRVNSAIVMHNTSTQFADGGEFGFGGEVGIATGKLHARGPVGLEQLTTFKYVVAADCGVRK
jgi:glutamate-5-semialdehyde dehydrogenase